MIQFTQPQIIIEGISLNLGIAHGQAYMYDPENIEDRSLTTKQKEKIFLDAVQKAVEICSSNLRYWQEKNHELILVQKALLQDVTWQQRIIEKINLGANIIEALTLVLNDLDIAFGRESFWQARFQEVKGITQLVRQCLTNKEVSFDKVKPIVLCAKTISPIEMMQFDQANLVGLVVEDSSFISHGMIIARSRKIPVVGGVIELKKFINNNDQLLIDGDLGRIYVRPQKAVIANYDSTKKVTPTNSGIKSINSSEKIAVISRDGIAVDLYINANIS